MLLFIISVIFQTSLTNAEFDPCINYTIINNVDRRAVANVLKLEIIPPISDDFLDSGWYRIESDAGEEMPTAAPGLFHCGTWYPIWLNGTIPKSVGDKIVGKVCLQGIKEECYESWTTEMTLCPGNYLVYNLIASNTANSGYCFGTSAVNNELTTTSAATTAKIGVTDEQDSGFEPCNDHSMIQYQEKRAVANTFNFGEDSAISDDLLNSGWYRVERDDCEKMPTSAPGLLHCGTWYPIWLNGQLPTTAGEHVQRKVCMQTFTNECTYSWDVDIKLCTGGYLVYNLLSSKKASSGYCFGTGDMCTKGISDDRNGSEEDKVDIQIIVLIVTIAVAVLIAIVLVIVFCKKTKHPEKNKNYMVGGHMKNGKQRKIKCSKISDSPPPYKRDASNANLPSQIHHDHPPPYRSRESSVVSFEKLEPGNEKNTPIEVFTVKT